MSGQEGLKKFGEPGGRGSLRGGGSPLVQGEKVAFELRWGGVGGGSPGAPCWQSLEGSP